MRLTLLGFNHQLIMAPLKHNNLLEWYGDALIFWAKIFLDIFHIWKIHVYSCTGETRSYSRSSVRLSVEGWVLDEIRRKVINLFLASLPHQLSANAWLTVSHTCSCPTPFPTWLSQSRYHFGGRYLHSPSFGKRCSKKIPPLGGCVLLISTVQGTPNLAQPLIFNPPAWESSYSKRVRRPTTKVAWIFFSQRNDMKVCIII